MANVLEGVFLFGGLFWIMQKVFQGKVERLVSSGRLLGNYLEWLYKVFLWKFLTAAGKGGLPGDSLGDRQGSRVDQ